MNKSIIRQYNSSMPIGKLSEEDKAEVIATMGLYIDDLGENLYHLGGGALTGEYGWKLFNQQLKNKEQ